MFFITTISFVVVNHIYALFHLHSDLMSVHSSITGLPFLGSCMKEGLFIYVHAHSNALKSGKLLTIYSAGINN